MLFSGVTLVYGKNMLINLSYKSLHGSIHLLKCPQFTISSFSWFCLFVFWINSTILKLRPFSLILTSIPSLLIEVQGLQLHKAQTPYKDNYPCKYSGFFRPHVSYSRGTMGYHTLGIMTYTPKHNTYIHTGLLVFWMTTFILWMSSRHVRFWVNRCCCASLISLRPCTNRNTVQSCHLWKMNKCMSSPLKYRCRVCARRTLQEEKKVNEVKINIIKSTPHLTTPRKAST